MCWKLGNNCGGITLQNGKYGLRAGRDFRKSRTNEVSWAKRSRCQNDSWEDESCYDL